LSVRLERYVYLTLVTLALCATILLASPAAAEAKEGGAAATQEEEEAAAAAQASNRGAEATPTTQTPAPTHTVVVRPGDSLWSISEEHLGPKATPQQITSVVERIYALNRERIGADPDLIFSGQVLTLPPVGESSMNQPLAAVPPARGAAGAADVGESGEAPGPASERATLPELAAAQPVPTARSLTSDDAPGSSVASFPRTARSVLSSATAALVASLPEDGDAKRQLIGWVLLALSFTTACVLAFLAAREWWRRRAKRSMGELLGEEVYRTNYALFDPLSRDTTTTEEASRSVPGAPATAAIGQPSSAPADGTLTEGNLRAGSTGTFASARRKRRRRKSVRRRSERARPLREGLAAGAHNPNVRRHLRTTRGDAPRKRRRAKEPRRSVITRELANASKARGAQRTQGGR
jgi:hypothetical protein